MKFYSVVEKETQKSLWDLVEFENLEVCCYNLEYKTVILYDNLSEFISFNISQDEELIEDGVIELEDEEK